jgi:hypothetical protein
MKHAAKRVALLLLCTMLALTSARAEEPPPRGDWLATHPYRNTKLRRRVGIGLLIGSGASLLLGLTFVGLAKEANDSVLANHVYDPTAEDRRNNYQITQTVFFATSAVSFAAGMVLMFDR